MKLDDVLRMAQEAGFPVLGPKRTEAAERFAALVEADTIERCAKECEEVSVGNMAAAPGSGTAMYDHRADGANECAEAIRAMKVEKTHG